jgi:hypothetical protein
VKACINIYTNREEIFAKFEATVVVATFVGQITYAELISILPKDGVLSAPKISPNHSHHSALYYFYYYLKLS